MNCLECRRELLIDPRNDAADLITHVSSCKPCSQEREQLLSLESALESSFQYDVPAGLADRVLEINHDESKSTTARSDHYGGPFGGHIWQIAAGIFLVIGLVVYLGISQSYPLNNAYALEAAVINHVTDELHQLHGSDEVSGKKLNDVMAAVNTKAIDDIGNINYARKCQIRKNTGAHLITHGKSGPVTVLVMPGEHIEKDINITSSRFNGGIYSTAYGSLAVVGEKGEKISPIANKMLQSIRPATG